MLETELKFLLGENEVQRLRTLVKHVAPDALTSPARALRSIYLDTEEHSLKSAGLALRLRKDGRRWLQTVKADTTNSGGLQRALECEVPAPGGRLDLTLFPDELLRARIETALAGATPEPVCETVMKRSRTELVTESGARAELCIDVGEIVAGRSSVPFREAELELVEGDLGALFDLTAGLFPDGGLRISTMSKSERGYRLAETGTAIPPVAPRNAGIVPLDPKTTSEIAARDILRECFDQIAANTIVVLETDAPEGPHQLRIGLRRLRASGGMFRPVIGCAELSRLVDEAKWIGSQVGALRDMDVLITEIIDPEAEMHPSEPGFAALRGAVEKQREVVRGDLRTTLAGPRVQRFLIDLARFIETRGWLTPGDFGQTERLAAPIGQSAGAALDKRWKAVSRRSRGIDHLSIEARHDLRKELKKLRYVIEFMGPLYKKKKVSVFIGRMKTLQNVFGDLNDLAMAETLLCGPDSPGARNASAQRAVGWLLGTRTATSDAAWLHARELWHGVTRVGPFWR